MTTNGSIVTYSCVARFRARLSSAAIVFGLVAVSLLAAPTSAAAQDTLCDNAFQDCRTPLLQLINAENVGLDVSFWFMTDTQFSSAIINRFRAGVPVRIVLDLRADANYPSNATIRQSFINAGIPIRHKTTAGINHWKMLLFAGQNRVMF